MKFFAVDSGALLLHHSFRRKYFDMELFKISILDFIKSKLSEP
jgi:hypothetical protein